MTWEFAAANSSDLLKAREFLPETEALTVVGELPQMTHLIEALAKTEILGFPFRARHTGKQIVPDFQLNSGPRRIGVEMAKVTSKNLEHARNLQSEFSPRLLRFDRRSLQDPQSFAMRLKEQLDSWSLFVASRLSSTCRKWLTAWNGSNVVPESTRRDFLLMLNQIIDGPSIAEDPLLIHSFPPPVAVTVEEMHRQTKQERKSWLVDAFWESLAVPVNGTLVVSPFIREDDTRMSREEVIRKGFILPSECILSLPMDQELSVWVQRVCSEVEDKASKLIGGRFVEADEYWLVLWDRLGTPEFALTDRAEAVACRMASSWKSGWFSRIFIQDGHFEWLAVFDPNGWRILGK